MKALGVRPENTTLVDIDGVVYRGRNVGLEQWKSVQVTDTPHRTLAEALVDADVFIGVSAKGVLTHALGEVTVVGPILVGMSRSVQVCRLGDSPSRIVTMATLAAFGAQVVVAAYHRARRPRRPTSAGALDERRPPLTRYGQLLSAGCVF